jgi:hypothetical protein
MTYTFIDNYRHYSSVRLYLYNGDDRKYSKTKFNSQLLTMSELFKIRFGR